jgi:hypothetical protein
MTRYPLLDTISDPAQVRELERKQLPQLADELRSLPGGIGVQDRRAPFVEPRYGRTHGRPAPRIRYPARPPGVGRRPPDLRAQGAHRSARRHGPAAHARRRLGLPEAQRERSTTLSASVIRRPRSRPRSAWRWPPRSRASRASRGDHRRWRDVRRPGLRGAEQCRRRRRRHARHPQR